LKKGGGSSVYLGVTAALSEYFVSMSEKGGNTEKRADVPVIFFDKGIDLAVQMIPYIHVARHTQDTMQCNCIAAHRAISDLHLHSYP
jgi:hypothetical protein